MTDYAAYIIPVPSNIPIYAANASRPVAIVVQSANYAATVNPAFGQNITELDG